MPDLVYLIGRWWKQMLFTIILATLATAVIVFLIPSRYLSVATALPANSYATDKGSVFSNNTQTLYPALGTPEDLDMILGTAHLDTVYLVVARKFQLPEHYAVEEQGDAALRKAVFLLKKRSSVTKSEFNEIKVKVWDTNRDLAPQIANAILETVQAIHRDIQNRHNVTMMLSMQKGIALLRQGIDSIAKAAGAGASGSEPNTARISNLLAQLQEYEKLENQYRLLADNKPQVIIIVERAVVADWPDTPDRPLIIIATFVLSCFFALLVALLLDKRKSLL